MVSDVLQKVVTFRVLPQTYEVLEKMAKEQDRTVSYVARQIVLGEVARRDDGVIEGTDEQEGVIMYRKEHPRTLESKKISKMETKRIMWREMRDEMDGLIERIEALEKVAVR